MRRVLPALLGGLLIGVLAGWLLSRGSSSGVAGPSGESNRAGVVGSILPPGEAAHEIERLRGELELERAMRESLLEHLESVEARLAEWEGVSADAKAEQVGAAATATDPHRPGAGARGAPTGSDGKPWFSDEALAGLGLSPREVERLRARWEQHVMDQLHLADEKARGQKPRKVQLMRARRSLEASFREQVGEEGYDAILYATGQNNRVILSDLLESSPAGTSGVEPGDTVISYDNRRVFKPAELKHATSQCVREEWVPMVVQRDGENVRLYIPCGPMGVQLKPTRSAPRSG